MSLILAAAQSSSVPGDIASNVARHLRFADAAAAHGAQLLVFPELSLTGYELALARAGALRPDSPLLDPLRDFAVRSRMTIVAGAPVPNDQDQLNIAALAFGSDGLVATYTKVYVHQSEEHVFTSGPGGANLRVEDASVALAICADVKHPQHAAAAAARGAGIYAAGAMIIADEYPAKVALLENYAREHAMAVLLANYSGSSGGLVSAGKSAIWSEDGRLVAATAGTEEALVFGVRQNARWTGFASPVTFPSATTRQESHSHSFSS